NFQWCPKFNNLSALKLGERCLPAGFYAPKVFLQNCPNLVKLTLKPEKVHATIIGELEEGPFTCQHVQMLEVVCSEGDRNVVEKLLVLGGITSGQVCFRH
ncbi:hypothetical protein BAE44_0015821, partial [Dichanthelium oligosanthes]